VVRTNLSFLKLELRTSPIKRFRIQPKNTGTARIDVRIERQKPPNRISQISLTIRIGNDYQIIHISLVANHTRARCDMTIERRKSQVSYQPARQRPYRNTYTDRCRCTR